MERNRVRAASVFVLAATGVLAAASPAGAAKSSPQPGAHWISSVVDVQPAAGCTRTLTARFTSSGKAFTNATLSVTDGVQAPTTLFSPPQNYTGPGEKTFSWRVTIPVGTDARGFAHLQFVNGTRVDAGTIDIPTFGC